MLIGIPGSGKSSFCKENLFDTHVRISLDLVNTRNKEWQFMALAFSLHQRMVLDNTNVTKAERAVYIAEAKRNKFTLTGYYFESRLETCLKRNEGRTGKGKINKVGVIAKHKALELPSYAEGFDKLYYVRIENDQFQINPWNDEI
ncbi:AAA family ATPase [Chryseolinea soli]|nr:AAA family ATPase [Chryseolinea soli]